VSQHRERHHGKFSRFCRNQVRDRQTDRQTTLLHLYIAIRKEWKGKEEYLHVYSAFSKKRYIQRAKAWITQFYLQTTPCLPFPRGVHQMSPPQQLRQQTSNCSSLLIYRPRKDEMLSWPSWLTCSGWLTHISGHPSATSRAQDSESTSAKDQCSTAGPRNQPIG